MTGNEFYEWWESNESGIRKIITDIESGEYWIGSTEQTLSANYQKLISEINSGRIQDSCDPEQFLKVLAGLPLRFAMAISVATEQSGFKNLNNEAIACTSKKNDASAIMLYRRRQILARYTLQHVLSPKRMKKISQFLQSTKDKG